jgi:hypothetical protein
MWHPVLKRKNPRTDEVMVTVVIGERFAACDSVPWPCTRDQLHDALGRILDDRGAWVDSGPQHPSEDRRALGQRFLDAMGVDLGLRPVHPSEGAA